MLKKGSRIISSVRCKLCCSEFANPAALRVPNWLLGWIQTLLDAYTMDCCERWTLDRHRDALQSASAEFREENSGETPVVFVELGSLRDFRKKVKFAVNTDHNTVLSLESFRLRPVSSVICDLSTSGQRPRLLEELSSRGSGWSSVVARLHLGDFVPFPGLVHTFMSLTVFNFEDLAAGVAARGGSYADWPPGSNTAAIRRLEEEVSELNDRERAVPTPSRIACAFCNREDRCLSGSQFRLVRCSGCTVMLYCGIDHQRSHWPEHKVHCQKLRRLKDQRLDLLARIESTSIHDLRGMPRSY